MKTLKLLPVVSVAIILISSALYPVFAQSKKQEPQVKPENIIVWQNQAGCLAEKLNFSEEQTNQVIGHYIEIRTELNESVKSLEKSENQSNADGLKEQINEKAFNKLEGELKSILNEEQMSEALLLLGSFNKRWDQYQKNINSINLSGDKQREASILLCDYIKKYLTERAKAASQNARFSGRVASDLKANLDNSLKPVLTEEQMEDWMVKTQRKPNNK